MKNVKEMSFCVFILCKRTRKNYVRYTEINDKIILKTLALINGQ